MIELLDNKNYYKILNKCFGETKTFQRILLKYLERRRENDTSSESLRIS